MQRPIILLTLLLTGPSLASAQDPSVATTGSMVVQSGNEHAPYNIAGPEFSTSGVILFQSFENPLNFPAVPGQLHIYADTSDTPFLQSVSLTFHGAPWVLPDGSGPGFASVDFTTNPFVFTGQGLYHGTFSFFGHFLGMPLSVQLANPGKDCDSIELLCSMLLFSGGGSVALDVVPFPNHPGVLEIEQATFTFKPVPEPSTAALLLLGFAGLAILGRRAVEAVLPPQCG